MVTMLMETPPSNPVWHMAEKKYLVSTKNIELYKMSSERNHKESEKDE